MSYAICEQQRCRSACASALSDQCLCCSLPRQNDTSSLYIRNFKILAGLCSWAGQFVSCLVGDSRRHIFSSCGSFLLFSHHMIMESLSKFLLPNFSSYFSSDLAFILSTPLTYIFLTELSMTSLFHYPPLKLYLRLNHTLEVIDQAPMLTCKKRVTNFRYFASFCTEIRDPSEKIAWFWNYLSSKSSVNASPLPLKHTHLFVDVILFHLERCMYSFYILNYGLVL